MNNDRNRIVSVLVTHEQSPVTNALSSFRIQHVILCPTVAFIVRILNVVQPLLIKIDYRITIRYVMQQVLAALVA